MDETAIISEIVNGNSRLFEQLVNRYQRQVLNTCMGFVHHREDAQDLAQVVFVKAYRALHTFEGKASFSTWLYRIAVNASLEHLRKKTQRRFISIFDFTTDKTETPDHQTPQHHAENNELQRHLKQAVDSLPENQRIAFVLSKYDDLPQAKIAQIMLLSEGAVESLLQRAKKNLQKKLAAYA